MTDVAIGKGDGGGKTRKRVIIVLSVAAILSIIGISVAIAKDKKPKRDTPFCPPGPNGEPQQWNAETGSCEPVNPPPKGDTDPDFPTPDPPTDPEEPGNIDDLIKVVPVGRAFYKVKQGDVFLGKKGVSSGNYANGIGIAHWLLRREGFEAAKQYGSMTDAQAWAWVNTNLPHGRLSAWNGPVRATLDLILCSAANDATAGTWGYKGKNHFPNDTDVNHAGPHGRAIRLLPQHPDQIARLRDGQALARFVSIKAPANAGDASSTNVSGETGKLPTLWMTELDRRLLWESKMKTVEPSPETWEDGSPVSSPPPWIWSRGIDDLSGTLQLPMAFGCAGQARQVGG